MRPTDRLLLGTPGYLPDVVLLILSVRSSELIAEPVFWITADFLRWRAAAFPPFWRQFVQGSSAAPTRGEKGVDAPFPLGKEGP